MRGSSSWPWLLAILVIAVAGGGFLWLVPPVDEGLVVYVRVLDADGRPATGTSVRASGSETWTPVDKHGSARLSQVAVTAIDRSKTERIAGAVQVKGRFFAERVPARSAAERADGAYDVEIRVHAHGLLTLRLEATTAPNPVAYLEPADHIVAVDGQGVSRISQDATYRVFRSPSDRVTLTVKGDTGIAMERLDLTSPGPGFVRQHDIRVHAARPITGRVIPPEGVEPPTLAGVLRVIPTPAGRGPEKPVPGVADPYVEIDPVQIHPDGTFLVPHARQGTYELIAELDFLGRADPRLADGGEDVDIVADARAQWVEITFPEDLGRQPQDLEYHAMSLVKDGAQPVDDVGVLHLARRTYVVVYAPSAFELAVHAPGTRTQAPMRALAPIDEPSGGSVALEFEPVPSGTVVVEIPESLRTAMRGGTLTVDVDGRQRTHSILRGLTTEVVMKHVDAGPASLRIDWQDPAMGVWFELVEVPAGDEVRVKAAREQK